MPEPVVDRRRSGELLICQEIERAGPMTFARFMDIALYHPAHGYYQRGGSVRGRSGDYFTSMQVSDLFPKIFAALIKDLRETLGSEQFSLVELGAGGGEFLEGVLKAMTPDERKGMRVWAVERSRPAREMLWKRLSRFPKCEAVASLDDIEWMGGLEGMVFSNEFFDALPFHRLKKTADGWREIGVGLVNGALADVDMPLSDAALPAACGLDGISIDTGTEVEARPDVLELYEDIGARLSRGWIVTVDYGHPAGAIAAGGPTRGSWRCFSEHQMNDTPYVRIGRQDITANVDFTQLESAGRTTDFTTQLFASQGVFLSHAGRAVIERELAKPNHVAVARAVKQLLHPDAMGERFWTLVQGRAVEIPPALAAIPNRASRLTKV